VREEENLCRVDLEQRTVDDVSPSLFGEDENVHGREIDTLE
jgi:hypothetical protein